MWDANSDGVTNGYRIYYGTAPGAYQPVDGIDVGNVTEFQLDLTPGLSFYFVVRAYDAEGELGPPSAEFFFSVPISVPTIQLSPAFASPGSTLTATISNAPGGTLDAIGLYRANDLLAPQIDWKYLNNSRTPPATGMVSGTVTFTAPTINGNYEVRFLANGGPSVIATSAPIVVAPTPTLSINDVTVTEGNSGSLNATFTVTLSPVNSAQTVTVNYATANGTATTANNDYVAANGTLSFSPGAATRTITVAVNGDTTFEPNETFRVDLTGAVNAVIGDGQGTGTITNNDAAPPPAVSIPGGAMPGSAFVAAVSNGPAARFDWVGLYPVGGALTTRIDWYYLNGSKTAPASGVSSANVSFNAPSTPGNYHVRFFANDTTTVLATSGTLTVSPGPSLSINDVSVTEGNSGTTTATFTVTLSPVNASQTVTVNYATANGGATTANSDYIATSGTLSFAPGAATRTIAVTINGDTAHESNETFGITLTGATNAIISDAQGVGTIVNDDAAPLPTVTVPATVSPGSTFTATVSNGPASPWDWLAFFPVGGGNATRIDWFYLNGSKNAPPSGYTAATVPFTAPSTPGNYEVRLYANNATTLLATSSPMSVATAPTLSIGDVSVTESNSGTVNATFTVTMSPVNASQTVTVNYATANGTATTANNDYVATSGTLSFTPSASSRTVTVVINGDSVNEQSETFVVNLSGAVNAIIGDAQGIGTIVNDDGAPAPAVAVPASVSPGTNFTVSVTNGPGNPMDWVALFPAGGSNSTRIDWFYLNGLKTGPTAGVSTAAVSFTAPATPGTYEVRLFANNAVTLLATSQPIPVAPTPTLSINNVSVTEGNSGSVNATFTVTLSPVHASQTVTVNYATANGSASTANNDYVAANGTLSFPPSTATRTFTVAINGDNVDESIETFVVNLSGAVNAVIGGSQGTGTIMDDDASGPSVSVPASAQPGSTFTVSVGNGPANRMDWVALFPVGGSNSTRIDWFYLNGLKTAPTSGMPAAVLTMTAPSTPGTYEVRFFANNVSTLLATSLPMPVASSPTLAINNVTVTEGNSGSNLAQFTVTLAPANPSQTVTVNYATANGTATTANNDYTATSGTLSFAAGETTKTISVPVNGDSSTEANETFLVNLSGATNAVIGDSQGAGIIVDDDGVAGPAVNLASTTVQAGRLIEFTVSNGPGNLLDWVALAQSSAPDSSYLAWTYLNGAQSAPTTAVTTAALRFIAPSTPGTYVIRLFANNRLPQIASSAVITVVP
jgi:large repetitive protein